MKIFWVWFTDTNFWEVELCVTVVAITEENAKTKAQEWVVEYYNKINEEVDFNLESVEIKSRELNPPTIINHTWELP
jgi:hypothetical protein